MKEEAKKKTSLFIPISQWETMELIWRVERIKKAQQIQLALEMYFNSKGYGNKTKTQEKSG